ncbi:MAG TPA: DegT/DnrJ/EryC1/StrS family aminotransferase [Oscillatoriaceae cyanobacterium]
MSVATSVPFLDLRAQHRALEHEIMDVCRAAILDAAFIGGPQVEAFEQEFAAFCESPYAIGVNSGTDALRFALIAAGVGPGDEVVTVPNTFIATTEAISQVGATIRFVDVLPGTANLDPAQLEAAIGKRTKAIVPVHLYGQMAEMGPILAIARAHGLVVVEDACQAHGARYEGRRAGTLGDYGCFSFYPGKNLGACGEGGAVTTSSADGAARIRRLREHGQSRKYHHQEEGYNGRLDAIQAGILRLKLQRLEGWNAARRAHADAYRAELEGTPGLTLFETPANCEGVYHLMVIRTDRRAAVQAAFEAAGIGWGIHYPIPLHLQPAYASMGLARGSFPVAEAQAEQILSIPIYPELTAAQRAHVVRVLKEVHV